MLYVHVFSYLSSDDIMTSILLVDRSWLRVCQQIPLLWKQIGRVNLNGGSYVEAFQRVIQPLKTSNGTVEITSLGITSTLEDPCSVAEMTSIIERSGSSLCSLFLHNDCEKTQTISDKDNQTLRLSTLSHLHSLHLRGGWNWRFGPDPKPCSMPLLTSLHLDLIAHSSEEDDDDYEPPSLRAFVPMVFHQLRVLILCGSICQSWSLGSLLRTTSNNTCALPLLEHFILDGEFAVHQMVVFTLWLPSIGHQLQRLVLKCARRTGAIHHNLTTDTITMDPLTWPSLPINQWPLLHTLALHCDWMNNEALWARLVTRAHVSLNNLIIIGNVSEGKINLREWCHRPRVVSIVATRRIWAKPYFEPFVRKTQDGVETNNVIELPCIAHRSTALIPPSTWLVPTKKNTRATRKRCQKKKKNPSVNGGDQRSDNDSKLIHMYGPMNNTPRIIHDNVITTKKIKFEAMVRSKIPVTANDKSFLYQCHVAGMWLQFVSESVDTLTLMNGIADRAPLFDIHSITRSNASSLGVSSSSSSISNKLVCPMNHPTNNGMQCICKALLPKVKWRRLYLDPRKST
jgi:hypothetical protein